jgi:hypothetical protein
MFQKLNQRKKLPHKKSTEATDATIITNHGQPKATRWSLCPGKCPMLNCALYFTSQSFSNGEET